MMNEKDQESNDQNSKDQNSKNQEWTGDENAPDQTKDKSRKAAKKATLADSGSDAASKTMRLAKNHGLTVNGRASRHYPAGSEFDPEKDAAVITALVRAGARFA